MTILNNALSGAIAAQASLNTVSQNVANLQTKGYTRQGVLLSAVTPGIGTMAAGYGVKVGSLLRFSDSYKSQQLWRSNSELGQYTQTQPYLTQLERVMGDDKTSLSNGIDKFFQALNLAGSDVTSTPLRQQVITAANAMAETFNSIYAVTRNQRISVDQQRESIVPQFNTLLSSIARLNERITSAGALGTNTSGLIDERDLAIDSLAQLASIEVLDMPDGTRTISLKSGEPLVAGKLASVMAVDNSSGTPQLKMTFATTTYTVSERTLGGQLGGLGVFEQDTLGPLQASISDLANQLATMVNTQLAAGYNIQVPPTLGGPLFVLSGGGINGLLSITPGIQAADLAFSGDINKGGSDNLQALVALKKSPVTLTSIGSVLVGDADTQLVGKLGIDSQQNQALMKTSTAIRQQAEDDWSATSGVNKDEEAINLIEFQNMYQANMKVIAVANSLFDSTLAMFG